MASPSRTVKVKFDGDAQGVATAAKKAEGDLDKFSKNSGKKFQEAGEKSAKRFGGSLSKWFRGEGGGLFKEIGKSGGTVFGSGLLGALKTPILGPALVAAMAGAASVAMPAAGAVAGTGFVTGFGAGIAGLGLMFAAKSEAVQSKWKDTLGRMGADMRVLAKPFERTLINIATIFERTVGKFEPALGKAFEKMAGPIEAFADQAGRALEQLAPVIEPTADAFNKVLASMGPALQSAVGNLAAGMTQLANSVSNSPDALADLTRGIGAVTRDGLAFLATLNEMNGRIDKLTGGVSATDAVFAALGATVRTIAAPFELASKGINGLNILLGRTHTDSADAGASMLAAANSTVKLAQASGAVVGPVGSASQATQTAAEKAAAAKTAYDGYIASLFRLQNMALGLAGSQINLQAAIDGASAAVKENGRATDINTEKGRANRQALLDVASAANSQTQAMLDAGKGNDASGLAAERSRSNFVRLATQMGYSKTQANAMAASMIAIPNVSRQAKLTAQKKDLDTKLADARRQLKDKNLTATKRAKLEAEIGQLLAAKATAQTAIDSLRGKTVTITYWQKVIGVKPDASIGVRAPGRASGGLVQPRRTYLVGERGPELLTMPGFGGRVTSNEQMTAAVAASPAEPTYLEAHIEIGGEVVSVVRTELKRRDRELKRTVKAGGR